MSWAPETLPMRFRRVAARARRTLLVSPDDFRVDDFGVYSCEGNMGLLAWQVAADVFSELLPRVDEAVALCGIPGAGKSTWLARNQRPGVLYFDAMLHRRATRRYIVALCAWARRPIDLVFIDTPLDVCLSRNAERSPERRVPRRQMLDAHRKLTVCPPTADEGWRTVVRLGPDRESPAASVDGALDSASRDL